MICGAGRGVGKTHLAQRLGEVLPNSVYAKCGHGQSKEGKPSNFFNTEEELTEFIEQCAATYDHIVVESNARARRGVGDIIVFVDAIDGQTDVRDDVDELRSQAHLWVYSGASVRDWQRLLRRQLADRHLCQAVGDILVQQKQFLSNPGLAVRTKVWFETDGMHAFGSGLARLLEGVERTGTLTEAARAARISYRHAWDMIRAAEQHLGKELILPQSGGIGGGQSALSADGRHLLGVFRRVNREVASFANAQFVACHHEESPDE